MAVRKDQPDTLSLPAPASLARCASTRQAGGGSWHAKRVCSGHGRAGQRGRLDVVLAAGRTLT